MEYKEYLQHLSEEADKQTSKLYQDLANLHHLDVEKVLGVGGIFAKKIPGFKVRNGQLTMAKAWQDTVYGKADERVLVCEAGTGTGKTFAYLIPAILSQKTVVISTASKALQDQLVQKDLPNLFDILNLRPDFMSLKGFSNYLCRRKFEEVSDEFVKTHALNFEEVKDSTDTASLKVKTVEGKKVKHKSDEELLDEGAKASFLTKEDLAKLQMLIDRSDLEIAQDAPCCDFAEVNSKFRKALVEKITCSSESCHRSKCKFSENCFAYLARQKATQSKVVVINHSLFFSSMGFDDPFDLDKAPIMLPKYSAIIFDEAHELPSIGREHLSHSIGSHDIKRLKEDLVFIKKNIKGVPIGPTEERFKHLFRAYQELGAYFLTAEAGGENKRNILYYKYYDYYESDTREMEHYQEVNKEFRQKMGYLYTELKLTERHLRELEDNDKEVFKKIADYVSCQRDTVVALMNLDNEDEGKNPYFGKYVGYVDIGRKSYAMNLTPLEISDVFGEYLNKAQLSFLSVLLTSATISVNHDFKKFLRDLGGDLATPKIEVASNFDYVKQSSILKGFTYPSLNNDNRMALLVDSLSPLIDRVKGGIFFLTTSYQALNSCYAALLNRYKDKKTIFCQNKGMSNPEIIKRFKENGKAILVGTSSFWAGVDVPGDALSLVVIDKLPFETPSDPVFRARCKVFDIKNPKTNHFIRICVPEAVIDLRQGVGRLIRHETDKGGIIIADPRLETKNFGQIFLKSLPQMTECHSLDEMLMFIGVSDEARASALNHEANIMTKKASDIEDSDIPKLTQDDLDKL